MSESNPERRRFYRIDTHIGLACRALSAEGVAERLADPSALRSQGTVLSQFQIERESLLPVFRELQNNVPTVARYIKLLEQQIDQLARIVGDPNDHLPDQPTHQVNLSAQGVRFTSGQGFAVQTPVELELKLFPSRIHLLVLGEVVLCDPVASGFDVAVDFKHIGEVDQELLVKHIHQAQLGGLQQAPEDGR